MAAKSKLRIAHLSGPNATIQNTPPLVTSNKARQKYGLPPLTQPDGSAWSGYDALRTQRLAAPAKVYVEQFSAHPLERDAAELYGPPDGYIDVDGVFHKERRGTDDKPVYEIELRPRTGSIRSPTWRGRRTARPGKRNAPRPTRRRPRRARVLPRRLAQLRGDRPPSVDRQRRRSIRSRRWRRSISIGSLPPSGYTKGLPAALRTDVGEGDIAPETRGKDFFPYKPRHLATAPPRPGLGARHQHRAESHVERPL